MKIVQNVCNYLQKDVNYDFKIGGWGKISFSTIFMDPCLFSNPLGPQGGRVDGDES